ncbi:MAG: TIGR02584 family CRISPR-associated protein [Deltaproteobacteria bacterium]|nr:TIGR02584 family CRISPR-associated protein [Candidatus Tharpella aukensis]
MSKRCREKKSRRVLLSLCGLSPQVVTETLYALVVTGKPAWIPDEVHVITTRSGRLLIEERLLHPEKGFFHQFCHEYGVTGEIDFSPSMIHVVSGVDGELEDIRTSDDNRRLADYIMAVVKECTSDPQTELHASLAGGRKTMSLYLGMAMQFFARRQDVLSHVLVGAPFENHPDFFYPPVKPVKLTVFDRLTGQPYQVDSTGARIELAHLPFVRLRDRLPEDIDAEISFADLVDHTQKCLDLPVPAGVTALIFYPDDCCLRVASNEIILTPVEAAIYNLVLLAKKSCRKEKSCAGCHECYMSPFAFEAEAILRFLENRWGAWSGRLEKLRIRLTQQGDRREWFLQHRSRLNRKIRRVVRDGNLEIISTGPYGQSVYGIKLDKQLIVIIPSTS